MTASGQQRGARWRVFLICAAIMILDGIDGQSIAVVAPLMATDLGLSMGDIGVMFAVMQAGAILGAVSFGWAADRIGRKPMILAGLGLIAVFTLLTAFDQRYIALLIYRLGVGVGMAGLVPCVLALTSEYSSPQKRGTVVAVFAAGYPLGAAAGAFGGGLLAELYGWEMVFYVGGILPLLLFMIALAFLPESAQWLATKSGRHEDPAPIESAASDVGPKTAVLAPASDHPNRIGTRAAALLFDRSVIFNTLLLWAFCFFVGCVVRIVSAWLPTLLVATGLSVSSAANVLGVSNLACTAGMAVVGWLLDRWGARPVLVPALLACAACAAGLGGTSSLLAIYLLASAVGFLMGMAASGSYALPAVIYPTEIRSSGIGFGAGASRLGTTLAPLLVGYLLAAAIPVAWVYFLVGSLAIAASASVLFLRAPVASVRN